MNISQKIKSPEPLTIGEDKPEKRLTFYKFFTKIGNRILGAFYFKFKF